MSWLQIKRIVILNNRQFLNKIVMCDEKWIVYNWFSDWTGRGSKARQTSTKNVYGHCLVVCCQSDTLQCLESQGNHCIWEVCSANQWDVLITSMPSAGIGQQNGPNSSPRQCLTTHCTTNASKVEWIGLWSFASSTIFTWPLANWLPLLQASQQLFAGKCLHK